jgi:hypothetical protein
MNEWLKALKDRVEPIAFVGIVGSVFTALVFVWKVLISPQIHSYEKKLESEIRKGIDQQISQLKDLNDNNTKFFSSALDQIRHKIADEFDSTYYLTKSFIINKDASIEQEPLSQFFYAADKDVVLLFIWSSGTSTKMQVSINGGAPKSLEDFGKHSWTNVDITEYVKKSNPLNEEQYPGIGENVYYISIVPIPKKLMQKQVLATVSQGTSQKTVAETSQKEESGSEVDIYALLIVRRSPFQ